MPASLEVEFNRALRSPGFLVLVAGVEEHTDRSRRLRLAVTTSNPLTGVLEEGAEALFAGAR